LFAFDAVFGSADLLLDAVKLRRVFLAELFDGEIAGFAALLCDANAEIAFRLAGVRYALQCRALPDRRVLGAIDEISERLRPAVVAFRIQQRRRSLGEGTGWVLGVSRL